MSHEPFEPRPRFAVGAVVAVIALVAAGVGFFAGWRMATPEPGQAVPVAAGTPAPAAGGEEPADIADSVIVADEDLAAAIASIDGWPPDRIAPSECGAIDDRLERACNDAGLDGVCDMLRGAVVVLAQRPPIASGELYEHENVIANTFHLFRVLGRERTDRFRELADERNARLEPLAVSLYRWAASREMCGEGDERNVTLARMDDYAVWMLSTLGGQAYLHRRSPAVEGLATFFALVTVDRAIREGREPYGFDPRPFLPRCEALIRGTDPAFRDAYLDVLTRFRQRWGGL